MSRARKILLWMVGIILGLPLLLWAAFPLVSLLAVDSKYERFAAMHPPSEEFYEASIAGAQPEIACGGTAGRFNFGENVRRYVSLNGLWEVAQGGLSDEMPPSFPHRAPVPGLLSAAEPAFENLGVRDDARHAFWYRRSFEAPEGGFPSALLCVGKAKYGLRAWLNGVPLGDHFGAFTQAEFDMAEAVRWGERNELILRVGAERSQLPPFIPAGQDHEKTHYIPGIWDDVNLLFTGEQTVVRVKVETDIRAEIARVFTTVRNNGDMPVVAAVTHRIEAWRGDGPGATAAGKAMELQPKETRIDEQQIALNGARLWQLRDPFLYVLHTSVVVDGDVVDDRAVRFGFREAAWRGGDVKGFYLNGAKTFLRGSNFSLHRFFEDELAGTLAWDEQWVRRLFTSYPRDYQWNSFRTSIGRLPNFWYHIADEEGFLIDDEFAWWTLAFPPKNKKDFDRTHLDWSIVELEKEFTSWLQESWNHPSIVLWSASNETVDDKSREVIARVRQLDTTRNWENGGWQAPQSEGDPIEDHPYVFAANFNPMTEILGLSARGIEALDQRDGQPIPPTNMLGMTYPSNDHPHIINEYGWLWLNRDGSPTLLTEKVYEDILGEYNTTDSRRETYAYFHAGLTGFWRSKRGYQGVQHFSYLSHSKPGTGYTSDNFIDMPNLVIEPRWHEYHRHVWSPVAVYIDRWRDEFRRGRQARVPLVLINDFNEPVNGELELVALDAQGRELSRSAVSKVRLGPLARDTLSQSIRIPREDDFVLFARLRYGDDLAHAMVDRRKFGFAHPGVVVADAPEDGW